ncbi:MAG: malto-oligosyltrehalose synthase [Candidatus Omnitrophota bacterium]
MASFSHNQEVYVALKTDVSGVSSGITILSEEKLSSWIIKKSRSVNIPSSVYRLQFNKMFTFKHATAIIPYLKDLGIDAVYCSPFFQAVPGSLHGYNVADPNQINSEIGSLQDYQHFCDELVAHGLGQIVDVVPNHMGISGNNNQWWMDVLENGQSSVYARYFDIDWDSAKKELKGKVLLPVLGDFYGRVLENGELRLAFEAGAFSVHYYERVFPVDPQTYPMILEMGLHQLQQKLGKESNDLLEYLSVMTSFKNLPYHADCSEKGSEERNREKEIAKSRLAALVGRCVDIRECLGNTLNIFNGNKAEPRSFDLLDVLLGQQAYRLGLWSVAVQEINYRRFFNINDLAAIRIEDERVFQHYHRFLFTLIREGKVSGLRIDHPDGLYDPPAYFKALQRECLLQMLLREWDGQTGSGSQETKAFDIESARGVIDRLLVNEFSKSPGFFVVVEKILDREERLPKNWNIHGTVGYDFMNALNGLFVDKRHESTFAGLYEGYIGHKIDFEELVYSKKKFFALVHMASEINSLGNRLDQISETNRLFRDFTRNDLTLAIREVIACFPVYRTYVSPDAVAPSLKDVHYVELAVEKAKKKTPALNPAVYDFLRDVLLLRVCHDLSGDEGGLYKDFLLRFQQLTAPIMAKGFEDTSFYVYNRLISLNEVGGDPFYFGYSADDFHLKNQYRNKRWPYSFVASSTHDTKRSEDVRMRINVLSEMPDLWQDKILRWAELNQKFKVEISGVLEPRRNTEYLLYQSLVGVWPQVSLRDEDFAAFNDRIWEVVLKSIREAKIYTSWIRPDLEYEGAVKSFTHSLLTAGPGNAFLDDFLPFQRKIAFLGRLNSLSALLLKICSPGVVDTFQGDELWNYCLVDPDNRRQVDFDRRMELMRSIDNDIHSGKPVCDLMLQWGQEPDKVKLFLLSRYLCFRRANKEVFAGSTYLPAMIEGGLSHHVVAFVRSRGEKMILAVAARFFAGLNISETEKVPSQALWQDTRIILPEGFVYPSSFKDVVTGNIIKVYNDRGVYAVLVKDVFQYTYTGLLATYEDK